MSERPGRPPVHEEQILFNVFLVEQQVGEVLNRALQDTGLTATEFALYGVLAMGADPLTPSELADQLRIPRSTLTGYLNAMDKRGHLTRLPNPVDGRSAYIALTPTGEETQQTAARAARSLFVELDQRLGDDLADVRRSLVRLYDALDESISAGGPGTRPAE